MGNTKENETVFGAANSIYAGEAGEAPGKALGKTPATEKKPTIDSGETEGRQAADATIRSHELAPDEGR